MISLSSYFGEEKESFAGKESDCIEKAPFLSERVNDTGGGTIIAVKAHYDAGQRVVFPCR